jgi:predicted membrane channel-forming protein YqfA (hemolysin III family)
MDRYKKEPTDYTPVYVLMAVIGVLFALPIIQAMLGVVWVVVGLVFFFFVGAVAYAFKALSYFGKVK